MATATPHTHQLFLRIVGLLHGAGHGLTIVEIAQALNQPEDVVATCLGLHVHLERASHLGDVVPIPLPKGFWIPAWHEVVTSEMLEPRSAGDGAA